MKIFWLIIACIVTAPISIPVLFLILSIHCAIKMADWLLDERWLP